jgi:hypothetical protein
VNLFHCYKQLKLWKNIQTQVILDLRNPPKQDVITESGCWLNENTHTLIQIHVHTHI